MTNLNDSFLNLLDHKLDNYQSKALHVTENAVIAAGAGSGKTQVLATRFAWLVMTGQAKVDEILTLTYTNKAAAEMYQRIYGTLFKFANSELNENLTKEQQLLAKKALEDFSRAHVQTLDSYCSSIVRQCANRYGIKPDFSTGSIDSERIVKDNALLFVLKHATNPGIQNFAKPGKLQTFAENDFAKIILDYTSVTTADNYFSNNLPKQLTEIVDAWNKFIASKDNNEDSIDGKIEIIKNACEESTKINNTEYAVFYSLLKDLFEKAEPLENNLLTAENVIQKSPVILDYFGLYNDFKKTLLKIPGTKGVCKDVGKYVTLLKNEIPFYDSIIHFIKNYSEIKSFYELLDDFLAQTNTSKRISGNLSFRDVSDLAIKALLENEDLRNQEKNAYKKIMIDEFQDNNSKNRDLLYILSLKSGEFEENGSCKITVPEGKTLHDILVNKRCPDKLFFVGDEKQSIYKFRGAEVSVFNELTQNNENLLIPMTNNYRSTPEMIKAFNVLFKNGNGIFLSPETSGKRIAYHAYYDKNAEKNGTQLPELNPQNIPIHALCFDTAAKLDDSFIPTKDQLAYQIASKIYELGAADKNWSSFAILDKSRTDRKIITKYLNLFGIPYSVDQQKDIFQDGVINDFYNFMRLCVYPSDKNALAAYLCSPFAGVSVEAMEVILLYPADDEIKAAITPEDYEKYQNALKFYEENRKLVLQQKITTTLSQLWNNKGYKYETMLNEQIQLSAEHFDILFELARQAEENQKTVSWFIDQLDLLKASFKENPDLDTSDISYPLERNQAVSIMTIHKSKGLEFDHVFLYGCTNVKAKSNKNMYFYDENFGVTVRGEIGEKNYFDFIQKDLATKKEVAEFLRLIYVGITRAIKDCYILCEYSSKGRNESEFRILERMLLQFAPDKNGKFPFIPTMGFDYIPITPVTYAQLHRPSSTTSDTLRKNLIDKATSQYQNVQIIEYTSSPVPRTTPSSLEKQFSAQYEQAENILQKNSFSAADFGTLVHSYLEMQTLGINPQEYQPDAKLLKNLTDAPDELQQTLSTCIQMCTKFASSPLGKALFEAKQANRFFRAEWAFRMFLNNTIFTGSIDLIFQNADGTYTIVDYKSDNQIDVEKYTGQQKCYRTAAAKLLKIPEEKIKLYLFFLKQDLDKATQSID